MDTVELKAARERAILRKRLNVAPAGYTSLTDGSVSTAERRACRLHKPDGRLRLDGSRAP